MSKFHRRSAFTLIEVLIVVIIMAVLAATIIPQFSASTTDAKTSSVTFNVHTIRAQIEMYKIHHNGTLPTLANFVNQMTKTTDVTGAAGTGTAFVYGPYFQSGVPTNPFTGTNTLVAVAAAGTVPTAIVAGGAGWQYDQTTGGFYPNNAEYFVNNPNP